MTDFDKFINEQNSQEQLDKTNKIIARYIEWVNKFYSDIQNIWLKKYINEGTIILQSQAITIHEESLGAYDVEKKSIIIGPNTVWLEPIGTCLLGTFGRIDMKFRGNIVTFIILGENITDYRQQISISFNGKKEGKDIEPGKPVWKYVDPEFSGKYDTLTTESFQRLLMNIISEKN